jgi:hypothetical protein
MRHFTIWIALIAALATVISCGSGSRTPLTQDDLVRNTQELFDAVAIGDQTPWKKYFADDCMYFDEKGRSMDKTALVNDITPLPRGYSGSIKLVHPKSHLESDVAILSYDLDESETIWGQNLAARYHGTDTWMHRKGKWQIVAGQIFRYYEDPAAGKVDTSKYGEYAGTYQLTAGIVQTVSVGGNELFAQRESRPRSMLIPEAGDLFFVKGVEGRRLFRRGDDGKVDAMIDRRNNEDVLWKKVR